MRHDKIVGRYTLAEGGETGNRWHGKKKTIMGEGARGKKKKKKEKKKKRKNRKQRCRRRVLPSRREIYFADSARGTIVSPKERIGRFHRPGIEVLEDRLSSRFALHFRTVNRRHESPINSLANNDKPPREQRTWALSIKTCSHQTSAYSSLSRISFARKLA